MSSLAIVLGGLLLVAEAGGGGGDGPMLPQKTVEGMLRRMMETEPFVGSRAERDGRSESGRYFTDAERGRLRGNPVLGYWDAGAFAWAGAPLVAWGGIRSAHPSCRGIGPQAWRAAFQHAARKQALEVAQKAAVKLSGGCVAAVIDPTDANPVPGVLVELRLDSPQGSFLVRTAVGKLTVEDAMGAALEFALSASKHVSQAPKGAGPGMVGPQAQRPAGGAP
jgi:hypothetical protein